MATAPFTEFEFSSGTAQTAFNQTDTGLVIQSQGIDFTWSVNDPAGTNLLQHTPGFGTPPFDGTLIGLVSATTPSAPQDVFRLGLQNSGAFFEGTIGNPLELDFYTVAGRWTITYHFTGGGSTTSKIGAFGTTGSGAPLSLTNTAVTLFGNVNVSHITFTTSTQGGVLALDDVKAAIRCFLPGTRIATPDGETAIETLKPGDRLLTAAGGETTLAWLGRQRVPADVLHPARVNPIRIAAGALAPGVPARDLYVSPDHALELDGLLINAGALVNGDTIRQVARMPAGGFVYYHLETDAHDLILAEGCAAESFVDYGALASFENADTRPAQIEHPEMPLPRIATARLVPRRIADRLAARARTLASDLAETA